MRGSGRGSGILPLSIDGVSVSLAGRRVLDNISLTIPQGERTVVLGPNGAGKTTLLRLCHGLLPPDSGELDWQGPEAIHRRQRQAKLGAAEVKTLDDLGDLAGDELIEILGELAPDADVANEIIMAARAHWFDDEDAPEAAANSEGGDETAGAADAEETASE